jgi:putative effector of murein hydrolase
VFPLHTLLCARVRLAVALYDQVSKTLFSLPPSIVILRIFLFFLCVSLFLFPASIMGKQSYQLQLKASKMLDKSNAIDERKSLALLKDQSFAARKLMRRKMRKLATAPLAPPPSPSLCALPPQASSYLAELDAMCFMLAPAALALAPPLIQQQQHQHPPSAQLDLVESSMKQLDLQ